MAHQLRTLDALAENPSLAPSTHAGWITATLVPGDLTPSAGFYRHFHLLVHTLT